MEIVAAQGLMPTTLDEALKLSEVLSKSNIVPKDYQGKPNDIFVSLNWGIEIGLAPMQSLQNIAVINGRPSIWGDAALALVRGSGKLEYIKEEQTDTEAKCTIKRKGEPEAVFMFTKVDAEKAGLWDTRTTIQSYGKNIKNPAPWHRYPKRMMQMRARSFALRDIFTDVIKGVGIAEEEQDKPQMEEVVHDYTEAAAPIDPLAKPHETEEATEAVIVEEEQEEDTITVSDINALYKKAPAEVKVSIQGALKEGWRESSPEELRGYYNTIFDMIP